MAVTNGRRWFRLLFHGVHSGRQAVQVAHLQHREQAIYSASQPASFAIQGELHPTLEPDDCVCCFGSHLSRPLQHLVVSAVVVVVRRDCGATHRGQVRKLQFIDCARD